MSEFTGKTRFVKKTRTVHCCEICERDIPIGSPAVTLFCVVDGLIDTPYFCRVCYDIIQEGGAGYIGHEDFIGWVDDNLFSLCPKCGHWCRDWGWSEDKLSLVFDCPEHGEWEHYIGFGAEQ